MRRVTGLVGVVVLMAVGGCAQQRVVGAEGREVFARGAVAADHADASEAGAEMLRLGGNAVDAAVASSFALSVVRPYSCGIGGGGFMVIHLVDDPRTAAVGDAVSIALDYRERSPGAVDAGYFEERPEADTRFSGHAVAVPGTVAGLLYALERYGTLERAVVMGPAIRLAEGGYTVDGDLLRALSSVGEEYAAETEGVDRGDGFAGLAEAHPGLMAMFGDGELVVGGRMRNLGQAEALRAIARLGVAGFTQGPVGRAVVAAAQGAGGALTASDLNAYRAVEREPLVGEFRGVEFVVMPPSSSGGVAMLQALGVLDRLLGGAPEGGVAYLHLLVESFMHAFADRARFLADTDFVDVPIGELLSGSRLDRYAARVRPSSTLGDPAAYGSDPSSPAFAGMDGGTSHVSVVDRWGNAVACTETINLLFGSRVVVEGFGFCLNNEMDDFLTRRGTANAFGLTQADRNLPAPGKRPLSSMSPTIVLRDGRVFAVAGASGGPRIITGTLQVLLNVLVFDMDAWSAVGAARVHHQWSPNVLGYEAGLAGSAVLDGLAARGHLVEERGAVGVVQLIRRAKNGGGWEAASDPRKGGAAAGH